MVNCAAMLAGDVTELSTANELMKVRPKVPIYEETYLDWTRDCAQFRTRRGYVEVAQLYLYCLHVCQVCLFIQPYTLQLTLLVIILVSYRFLSSGGLQLACVIAPASSATGICSRFFHCCIFHSRVFSVPFRGRIQEFENGGGGPSRFLPLLFISLLPLSLLCSSALEVGPFNPASFPPPK